MSRRFGDVCTTQLLDAGWRASSDYSRRRQDTAISAIVTIKIVPILLASLVSGCSTVVRLPPNAITPVSADRRVDALASLSSCAVTPTTTAYGAKTSREAPRVRPGNWYQTGWSTVSLDHVPADVAEALRNCRLFVQGTTANARDADLVMDLGVQIGCATSGGATAFTFLMIVGTLDVYPFLGGAFPTAARAELVCQLAPADGTGPARIYRSQFDMKGWAPMYTVVRKENQLATQALQAALRDIVDQIANDQNDLNRIAHAVRLRRLPSQSIASTVPSPAPAGIARPPLAMKRTAPNGPVLQRWALVIGISKYQDPDVPRLQYASADARAFHDWLTSPQGGAYDPDHVTLLCDEQATSAAIRDALFNWLKQPIEEDLVTIYYAGHGSPESPDNLKNLFLLPYDVDYSKIGSTGFPMWDIETSLKRSRARAAIATP